MDRNRQIRLSALWAAFGDALGFISELADQRMLRQRLGDTSITTTKAWTRRLGGQYGVQADLHAGTYSDDTQLRLATSRAIRGDGRFDVSSFAKVELVVWQSYALGAGRSTRAAAQSLGQKSRHWSTNFFSVGRTRYQDAGGNGAAMRIQPHVWAARDLAITSSYLRDVVRNTITTHGHPRALVGAAFHAIALARSLDAGQVPGPDDWSRLLDDLQVLSSVIHEDEELSAYWLPGWERLTKQTVERAISEALDECREELDVIRKLASTDQRTAYEEMILATKATDESTRGAGTKTAMLALALAWLRQTQPNKAVLEAANVLKSDTDTIGTMVGALVGAVSDQPPPGVIEDADYIEREADRLSSIAEGDRTDTFGYPDPAHWQAPLSNLDLVGAVNGSLGLTALGPLTPNGREWRDHTKEPTIWHWANLDFGQSVLIRRRATPTQLGPFSIGRRWYSGAPGPLPHTTKSDELPGLFPASPTTADSSVPTPRTPPRDAWFQPPTVDDAFEECRSRNFEPILVGQYILAFSTRDPDGHAMALAFASAIAKAWRSRRPRG